MDELLAKIEGLYEQTSDGFVLRHGTCRVALEYVDCGVVSEAEVKEALKARGLIVPVFPRHLQF